MAARHLRWTAFQWVVFGSFVSAGHAQEPQSGTTIGVEDLRSPGSPAFTLLDQAPSEIQRPSTPEALRASLASATGDTEGIIAPGYAVEVAPYWLESRPDLTFDDYYDSDTIGGGLLRNFAISLGSAALHEEAGTQATGTRVALGVRTSTRFGWSDDSQAELDQKRRALQVELKKDSDRWGARDRLDELLTKLTELQKQKVAAADELKKIRDSVTKAIGAEQTAIEDFTVKDAAANADPSNVDKKQARDAALLAKAAAERARKELEEQLPGAQASTDELEQEIAKYEAKRYPLETLANAPPSDSVTSAAELTAATQQLGGWLVEVASAAAVNFEAGLADEADLSDFAAWLTTGYESGGTTRLELLVLGRYKWQDLAMVGEGAEGYFDLGGRLAYNRGQLSVFFEGIGRWNLTNEDIDSTARLDGGASYRIAPGIYATLTIGRGFQVVSSEDAPVLARLALDVGGGPARGARAPEK